MSNNILDEAEKYTEPRTCPNCGYQVPLEKFVRRYVMSYGFLKWKCSGCQVLLKCDFMITRLLWLISLLPFGFLFSVLVYYFDLGFFNIIYLTPFFAFILLTFYYAKFEIHEE